jgi:serine/threonine protein kinase
MAAPPVTDAEFFELVRRSGVVTARRLDEYLASHRHAGAGPVAAGVAAQSALSEGLLTKYQAEQVLAGRYRNFLVAGKYLVLERIGYGGCSAVFLAHHVAIGRPVALKVLPPNHAQNPEALARFYREARAAAMLDHPNIADIYDVQFADNIHLLVMEYIYGPDLQDLVRKVGPLSPARAADYIRQAAAGLQHAHEAGLVHRDIKPGNLLVDRSGTVKILDLGLVRIFQSDDGLTKGQNFHFVLGTLDYQAPEQAIDSHEVDIRADIYSLGGTLYYLLTGQPVFPEGTVAEKLSWHQRRQPRPIAEYRPDVPAGLSAVVDRMMAKSPSDRYREPVDVVAALAEWAGEPSYPPSEAELPSLSKAARALLDARPRLSQPAPTPAPRPVRVPAIAAAPLPVPAIAAPSPAREVAVVVDSGRRAIDPAWNKPRFPRRSALVVAAAAAVVMVGTRINPFEAASTEKPATSAPAPAKKTGLVALLGTVAELDSQIEAETNPATKAQLLVKRGHVNSRMGRWRLAADDFRRAVELDPIVDWNWYYAIVTLVEISEGPGYRKLCLEMLRTFESSPDPLLAERIAKLWLLTPDCPGDPAIPGQLSDRALAENASKKLNYWVMSTKGLSEYRAGHFAEAASWLNKAIDATPSKTPQCKALSGLFLSMALQRQGARDQAKQAYDAAAQIIDRHQSQDGGDFGADWCDWLMCAIVRREAGPMMGLAR